MAKVYDNSGSLSRNERKEQPNHADYRGKATVGGVEYWISGWIKENEKGKWLSLSFQLKDDAKPAPAPQRPAEDDSDQIPF